MADLADTVNALRRLALEVGLQAASIAPIRDLEQAVQDALWVLPNQFCPSHGWLEEGKREKLQCLCCGKQRWVPVEMFDMSDGVGFTCWSNLWDGLYSSCEAPVEEGCMQGDEEQDQMEYPCLKMWGVGVCGTGRKDRWKRDLWEDPDSIESNLCVGCKRHQARDP